MKDYSLYILQLRRGVYIAKFKITSVKITRKLTRSFMDQLDACKDDEARRLLLGRSR